MVVKTIAAIQVIHQKLMITKKSTPFTKQEKRYQTNKIHIKILKIEHLNQQSLKKE